MPSVSVGDREPVAKAVTDSVLTESKGRDPLPVPVD